MSGAGLHTGQTPTQLESIIGTPGFLVRNFPITCEEYLPQTEHLGSLISLSCAMTGVPGDHLSESHIFKMVLSRLIRVVAVQIQLMGNP
jgi:hypothetical protein